MAEVLSWQNNPDPQSLLRRVVQALAEGQAVAFPTESTYVLAASLTATTALEQLLLQASSSPGSFAVAVGSLAQALELLPGMSPLAQRLARRCWPGPVTLLCPLTNAADVGRLPPPVCEHVTRGELALRCPAHDAILHVLRECNAPLATAAVQAITGEQAAQTLGEGVLLLDDGPCRYGQAPTVVRAGDGWELVQEGAIPRDQLQLQAACAVVFVCTGNTCRSPLAEALCKKKLADRLGCTPDELPQRGFVVLSAGVSACDGNEAAAAGVGVAREYGADLSQHLSRPLAPELAALADHLVCMTEWHLQAVRTYFPDLSCPPRLLNAEGVDLEDPVGQEEAVYRACAAQIWKDLDGLVQELTA